MMESTVKQQWNLHNFVLRSVFLRPRWRKVAELVLLRIMGTLTPSFSRTVFPFFPLFFHFPFLIFLPRIFKLKSLIIKLFHTLKKDKWLTDKFSFENEGPSETSKIKSVASIYARAYPDVQLNYGKKLFPEKDSLRKHPFLLALRRWGRFARRNVCDSETEIPYWWRKSMFT